MREKTSVPLFMEIRSKEECKVLSEKTGIRLDFKYPVALVFEGVKGDVKRRFSEISGDGLFEIHSGKRYVVILTNYQSLRSIGKFLEKNGLSEYGKWALNSAEFFPPPMRIGGRTFDFRKKVYIMGVINVTPDSFYPGSRKLDLAEALDTALKMEEEGADIIDIGGESTRPGANPVSAKEEIKRVIPVLSSLKTKLKIPVSVDTYKADVAEAAIKEGADMINDISGLRFDARMKDVILKYRVPVIIMHTSGHPKVMQKRVKYKWLLYDIAKYLYSGMKMLGDELSELTILDPGIGFGKTPEANLYILNHLEFLRPLKRPLLVGVSRKSFIGFFGGGAIPEERLEGTISSVTLSVMRGANIVRVHDVKNVKKALSVIEGLRRIEKGVVECG